MDKDFLENAEKITTFNIACSDFSHTTYKKEIRYLVNKHWFPEVKYEKVYQSKVTYSGLNAGVSHLTLKVLAQVK